MNTTEQQLMENTRTLKIAVVHDWLFTRRGGEKVLENILDLFPHADVFCLFGNPKKALKEKSHHRFYFSFLNKFPGIQKYYKMLLPFFPVAIESFDLTGYDLVISSSHCVAKGVIIRPSARHLSYVHSPMRYVWDQEHHYFKKKPSFGNPLELARRLVLSWLRTWDVSSSHRSDVLISNSTFVNRRCELYYGRTTEVIPPPVEVSRFLSLKRAPETPKKVLLFSAWVPYKKMYSALEFLLKNNIPVIAAGAGEELEKAKVRFANSKLVEFYTNPSDGEVQQIFERAHVLLFPSVEDFGIVVIEAAAAGMWVVAPNEGATRDTVKDGVTGFHFKDGNKDDMLLAIKKALALETNTEHVEAMRSHASAFSVESFKESFAKLVKSTLEKKSQHKNDH